MSTPELELELCFTSLYSVYLQCASCEPTLRFVSSFFPLDSNSPQVVKRPPVPSCDEWNTKRPSDDTVSTISSLHSSPTVSPQGSPRKGLKRSFSTLSSLLGEELSFIRHFNVVTKACILTSSFHIISHFSRRRSEVPELQPDELIRILVITDQ